MKWFEEGIAEAVGAAKRKGAVFVVFIEGVDEPSKKLLELLSDERVSDKIENGNFVAIKIEENSVPHQQFSQIYKEASKPSLFFIGKSGVPLEILRDACDIKEFLVMIDEIIQRNGAVPPEIGTENFIKAEKDAEGPHGPPKVKTTKVSNNTSIANNGGVSCPSATPAGSSLENSIPSPSESPEEKEERLRKYQEIIEKKREEREQEEKEKEKEQELKRRKVGQDVQKLKRWQEEQDLKQLVEQREKDKREEQAARQRVLAQIAQDKAERAARFGNTANNASPPAAVQNSPPSPPRPTNNPNTARLQLKLPDGSSHTHEFASSATLQDVRDFIAANLNLNFRTYTLSTMFPRREFTDNDNSQTLADLQLVPNAVVLILPINYSVVPSSSGGLFAMIWFFFAPIVNLLVWLKQRIFGDGRSGSTGLMPRTNLNAQQNDRTSETPGTSIQSHLKKKMGETTVIRREGNVHRLVDKDDKDDENNTWNGNSTQQM